MNIEVTKFGTVTKGLEQRVSDTDNAFEFEQNTFAFNMDARISSDKLWKTPLHSRTMVLYGGRSQTYDGRYVFKIDHEFPLSTIASSILKFNGTISINNDTYNSSTGTEFIIIKKKDIKRAGSDFAIRADKYGAIKEQLGESITVEELVDAGGFKINISLFHYAVISYKPLHLTIDEISLTQSDVTDIHDGWLELAVGKNRAAPEDYQRAIARLAKYTKKAEKMNCFNNDNCFYTLHFFDNGPSYDNVNKGMGFYVATKNNNLELCPLFVYSFDKRWGAISGGSFRDVGRFLRVR